MHQNIQYTNKHLLYARTLNGIYQKFMTKVHNKHLKFKETKREQIPEKVIYIVDNILATSEQQLNNTWFSCQRKLQFLMIIHVAPS